MSDFFSSIPGRCRLWAAILLAGSLLVPSLAMSLPAEHETFMKVESYRETYGTYEAALEEARKRLDAGDFEALRKSTDAEMADWVKEDTASGTSVAEAWETAYMGATGTIRKELDHDWLRRNAKGVQGFYRLQGQGVTGFLCVMEGDEPDMYAVTMEVARTAEPYASGELDGFGKLDGKKMQAMDRGFPEAPILVTFDGEKAVVTETEAFRQSGVLGNGVTLAGEYARERK